MANTYTLIAKSTITVATNLVTFTNIPNIYEILVIKWSARAAYANDIIPLQFNSASNIYRLKYMSGNGSILYAGTDSGTNTIGITGGINRNTYTASTFSVGEAYIPGYKGSGANKSIFAHAASENNATVAEAHAYTAANYNTSSAISTISFTSSGLGNMDVNSTFYLYGLKNT